MDSVITLHSAINEHLVRFDFVSKEACFFESDYSIEHGKHNLVIPFKRITGIEVQMPALFKVGIIRLIIDNNKYVESFTDNNGRSNSVLAANFILGSKKERPQLEEIVNRLKGENNIEVRDIDGFDAPRLPLPSDLIAGGVIKEYRRKCNICGHVFCYSEDDLNQNEVYIKAKRSADRSAAYQSWFVSQINGYAESAKADRIEDKIRDFSKCPNCGSKDLSVLAEGEESVKQQTPQQQQVPAVSSADELKKFKELLDSGVITQEEFDVKKKQLLGL